MASLVQVIYGNTGSTINSHTVSGTFGAQTAGNINVIITWIESSVDPVTISDTANGTYTLAVGPITDTTNNTSIWIHYFPNIVSALTGTNTVTANWGTQSVQFPIVLCQEWSGIATSSPLDVTASAETTTNTGNGSVAITTTNANDLIVTGFSNFSNGWTGAPGSGFTLVYSDASGSGNISDYKIVSSTGTYTDAPTSNTGGNTVWVAVAAAFKQSGGGPVSPTLTGNITVTGVPVVTLQYETDLTGANLVTGAVSPLFGLSPSPLPGAISTSGTVNPGLVQSNLSGTLGVTGSVNLGLILSSLTGTIGINGAVTTAGPIAPLFGSIGISGAVVPAFSPIAPVLTGSIGVHGSVTTNLPPGPASGNKAVPFPFYIYGL